MTGEASGVLLGVAHEVRELGGHSAYFTGGFVNGFTGEILQRTGSYVPVFAYFSGMYLLSLLALQILVLRLGVPLPASAA
jgi:nitrate/nitrite transporter NarK